MAQSSLSPGGSLCRSPVSAVETVNPDGGKPGLGALGDAQSDSLGAGLVPCRGRLLGLKPKGLF